MQKKLLSIINNSSLTDSQKSMWRAFLRISGDVFVKNMVDAIESNPEDLEFITKNLEQKIKTIDNPDDSKWEEIIKEEEVYLEK